MPTHVLRFWESRFSQIKPVKRAGGRRYYRPSDMRLIGGVKTLLHDQGMTIRGVQKLLREQGLKHVSSFSPPLFGEPDEDVSTPEVIEHAEVVPSAPASAARSTRDAEPAPIEDELPLRIDEEDQTEPDGSQDPEPVMFTHRRAAPEPEPELVAEVVAEPEPEAPSPAIPPTPHVPETDPGDDDAGHEVGPGVALRLRLVPKDRLRTHREDLVSAAERLKALLDRVS